MIVTAFLSEGLSEGFPTDGRGELRKMQCGSVRDRNPPEDIENRVTVCIRFVQSPAVRTRSNKMKDRAKARRFSERFTFLCPPSLRNGIEAAADRELTTPSEIARRAIMAKLAADSIHARGDHEVTCPISSDHGLA